MLEGATLAIVLLGVLSWSLPKDPPPPPPARTA